MPLITIEAVQGLSPSSKRELFDLVHGALVECFRIPDHDRSQRFIEHAPENFEIPPGRGPRYTIVTIVAFAGRSLDAKRALYRSIADGFERLGNPRTDVMILLQEEPSHNWGLRGGVAGCDLDIGFKIDV
jgi:phenylpyruvate tautomerase PptA (4-oxalocrotonate tautomerase family)